MWKKFALGVVLAYCELSLRKSAYVSSKVVQFDVSLPSILLFSAENDLLSILEPCVFHIQWVSPKITMCPYTFQGLKGH